MTHDRHDCLNVQLQSALLAVTQAMLKKIVALALLSTCICLTALSQQASDATQLYFVFLKRPANPPQLSKEAGEKLQQAHMDNIHRTYREGKLVMAGPFMEDLPMRGIFVFRAHSKDEALAWANSDPAVKAGRLEPELHGPWRLVIGHIQHTDDEVNLERYTTVLVRKGENWKRDAAEDLVRQHVSYLQHLETEGKVALAGPFQDDGDLRGVLIYRTEVAEAQQLADNDPMVKAQHFSKPEAHGWFTGKGVLPSGLPMK
jgi:uncharacterized protein YciI